MGLKKILNRLLSSFSLKKVNKQAWEKRVLLIREDAIGDFLLSTGGIRYYQKYFADSEVYLLADVRIAGLARLYVDENRLILLDKTAYYDDLGYRIKFLNKIRETGFQTVISSIHRSSHCNDIAKLSGAQITWGYERELIFPVRRFEYFNHKILSLDRIKKSTGQFNHVIDHEAYMVGQLTSQQISSEDVYPFIPVRKTSETPGYFVYLPEAGDSSRVYTPEKLFPVLESIAKRYQLQCKVVGRNNNIAVPSSDWIENLLGKTSLEESLQLVADAKLILGNETGLAHAAWILDQPLVMIYGGGHYGRFLPLNKRARLVMHQMSCFQCDWTCKYKERPFPCVDQIEASAIEEAVDEFSEKLIAQ